MSYSEPPPPPQYGAPPPPMGGAPQKNNPKAIWALVLGILGVVCCGFFTGIPALILGNMAKKEIDSGNGTGRAMAQAGFILGIVAIALGVLGALLTITGTLTFDTSTS